MPRETRWFIKTAIVYLFVALLLGVFTAVADAAGASAVIPAIRPGLLHLITVGWLTQMIFGVAYWILPRFRDPPVRGAAWPVWAAFVLMYSGPLLIGLAPQSVANAGLSVAGRVAEAGAGVAFAVHAWSRVYGR